MMNAYNLIDKLLIERRLQGKPRKDDLPNTRQTDKDFNILQGAAIITKEKASVIDEIAAILNNLWPSNSK